MTTAAEFDVVVAGAGIAGSAVAAALAGEGLRVLVVEPGQHQERRLAGELIHPTGLRGLEILGFAPPGPDQDTAPVRGFAVFHDRGAARPPNLLPYADQGGPPTAGLGCAHGLLRSHLVAHASALPGVTLLDDARVTALDLGCATRPVVTLQRGAGATQVRARAVIAADGAASPVRALAGIAHRQRRLSTMLGVMLEDGGPADRVLPMPGYGHVFVGAAAPVLAYAIGRSRVRVLIDVPFDARPAAPAARLADALSSLPRALRTPVERAAAAGTLRCVSHDVSVDAAVRGRVALVGDAGGCCHPLTATGMTGAVSDALALRTAVREHPGDLGAALALYGQRRRAAQRMRRVLAASLYEAFSGHAPELLVLRRGLERYWRGDARGRAASMALLALADVRLGSALREMAAVVLHGLAPDVGREAHRSPLLHEPRLAFGVSRLLTRHVRAAVLAR